MTAFPHQLSDRELLLLIQQDVSNLNRRFDRVEERLAQGDRRFTEQEKAIAAIERSVVEYRGEANRAINLISQVADAAARKVGLLDTRVEALEEATVIDGDDGKPVPIRELFIKQQREQLRLTRAFTLVATVMPVLVVIANRLIQVWFP